jgi:glucose-1-phosphate thymidylyltransferase
MKAIITCAGFATRLWPLTKDLPKPLLEVKGKPIVNHIIQKLMEIPEVDEIFIVTNGKFCNEFEKWGATAKFGVPVRIINDCTVSNEDRLGQIGDVAYAVKEAGIDDDVLIVAGDNLFNFSLLDAYSTFKKGNYVVNPLYDIKSFSAAKQLGTVVLNDDNTFAEFYEKAEMPKSTLVSLGIYFFPKDGVERIQEYISSGESPDKMGYFLTWLMKRETVVGHVYYEKWFDIGWIKAFEQARKEYDPVDESKL